MELFERFLALEVVVNIVSEDEYKQFINRCKRCRLYSIKQIEQLSFNDLHNSGGLPKYRIGDVCIEFQPEMGFALGGKQSYLNYGCEVISVKEFLEATDELL